MLEFHADTDTYFNIQYLVAKDHIIPYLSAFTDTSDNLRVLEIGCGEAGVLKAFLEKGHQCTGIELEQKRIDQAQRLLAPYVESGQVKFIVRNIYDINPHEDGIEPFDLIILKDVIEHIPGQEKIMAELKKLSKPGGHLFFAFPPWYMPFGGHQQIVKNKWISKIGWIHLLSEKVYAGILKRGGEHANTIRELLELKETGISIERFERIAAKHYQVMDRTLFLINPIYEYKFKIKKRRVFPLFNRLPFIRNFYTTCAYFLLKNG